MTMADAQPAVPVEITRANTYDVRVRWADGHESVFIARDLRLACPCAGCIDELTGHVRIIASSIAQTVHPVKISPIGRYAISIQWSDGHNTGIYSFDYLHKLDLQRRAADRA
jgi:ATP-binding protein involved in chromosome partitioning